jgi:hypothetical protein
MGIALARAATMVLLVAPVFLYVLMRLSQVSLLDLTRTVAPSVAASAAVVCTVLLFRASDHFANARPSLSLTAEVATAGAAGLITVLVLDAGLRQLVFANIGQVIRYPVMPR